jgi:hypothetical protein
MKSLKKFIPYIAAIVVFLTITLVYFSPLFEGKRLQQHDIAMFKGMSKEITDFRAKTGEEPLWTNSMFGGMPAWQISVHYAGNLIKNIDKVLQLWLPSPAGLVFLYFIGFFVLMLVLGVDVWLGMIGAVAFALSSYFFIILGAGHNSKAHAIGYMAPVLAGIIWTYRGKYLKGAALFALALALEINAGHLQITYYLLILILVYGIYILIENIRGKTMMNFWKATGILIIAALLAVGTDTTRLWGTWEYGKYTMRGKPELTKEKAVKSGGLDKDYITAWSYGIGETWSLLIPDVKGGASGYLSANPKAMSKVPREYRKIIGQQNAYWGDQPGTAGPVYVGAIVVFLFILGLFILEDRLKWALLAATILAIMLSWGKNFMDFTNFFIDNIPGYNKFRAVSMILVIVELTIPVIAILALDKILRNPAIILQKQKAFLISFGLTGGIAFIFWLTPETFFNFLSQFEIQQFNMLKRSNDPAQITAFTDALKTARIAIFKADAIRSFLFIVAAAALIYLFAKGKVKKPWLIAGIALLIFIDLNFVNRRYLNDDNFVRAKKMERPFEKTIADEYIFKDKSPDFRVLDITKNVFNDASTSYFHESIGGYHGAKLQRYQDLIDEYLYNEIETVKKVFGNRPSPGALDDVLSKQQVINMLNTKYIIYNPSAQPVLNRFAFGNAWFVHDYKIVENADAEIAALSKNDLKEVAVVDKRFAVQIKGKKFPVDASATIKLKSYAPNHLVYDYNSKANQLVVFSEIYYDKGWKAFIDGKESPYFRADYILRAMVVPAGKHTVEFKFEPKVWKIGEKISLISSVLLLLFVAAAFYLDFKKNKKAIKEVEKQKS